MKKLISLLLAAAFIYTALLCACTNKPEETSVPVTETEAVVSTEDIPGIHIINADRGTLVKGKRPWQLDTTVIRKNG